MKHDVIVVHDIINGPAVAGSQSPAGALLAPYVGGYILEAGLTWGVAGAVASIPARYRIGYGPNGGPGIYFFEYTLDTYYNGAVAALVNHIGGTARVRSNFRAGIPGGLPITSATTYFFAQSMDAAAFAAAASLWMDYTVWMP